MQYLIVTLSLVSVISAYPDGARGCSIGTSNVRELHVEGRNAETGTIQSDGFRIILSGGPLITDNRDPAFSNLFQFGQENSLVIEAKINNYMKGIHVIASGGTNVATLDTRTPAALTITDWFRTKESIDCKGVAMSSVTHTDPFVKESVTMSFKWPTDGERLFLDVTIVKSNNTTLGSQYYFTQYPMLAGTVTAKSTACGLFRLSFFCPLTHCGFFGRLLGLCNNLR